MLLVFAMSLSVVKVIFLPPPGNWKNPLVLATTQSSHHSFPSVIYLRHLGPHVKASFSTCRNVMRKMETVLLTVAQNGGSCTCSYKRRKDGVGFCCGTRPVGSVTDLGFMRYSKPGWCVWGRGPRPVCDVSPPLGRRRDYWEDYL